MSEVESVLSSEEVLKLLGATLGVGMLLGIKACVLVRASTNCQDVLSNSKGHQHTLLSYTSA